MRMTIPLAGLGAAVLLAVASGQGSATPARTTGPRISSLHQARDTTPLYTEEQAANGTALFKKVCVECHEPADYTGAKFREKWNGQRMIDLYEEIRVKMPDDKPGSLTRDEYAEALAYILKQNGLPAGTMKVAPDSAAMSAVKLELPPAQRP